jgi:hypothetical protein
MALDATQISANATVRPLAEIPAPLMLETTEDAAEPDPPAEVSIDPPPPASAVRRH